MTRIAEKYQQLKKNNQKAFTAYICAGDPDYQTSLNILKSMPKSGVDFIELGIPFLDPAGDGPIIEEASRRAIKNGMTLHKTLDMISEFRIEDKETPIILMGYFNPILKYGLDQIFIDAKKAGADGFLIVDLPYEEEDEILEKIKKADLDFIQLIAPTTSQERAKKIIANASGFLYLISILGITGTKQANYQDNIDNVKILKEISDLPIAIGFGIKTPEMAKEFCQLNIDSVVVGSSIVSLIAKLNESGCNSNEILTETQKLISQFAKAVKNEKC